MIGPLSPGQTSREVVSPEAFSFDCAMAPALRSLYFLKGHRKKNAEHDEDEADGDGKENKTDIGTDKDADVCDTRSSDGR